MAVKTTLLLCASALLVKVISGQCIGNPYGAGIYGAPIAGYGGCGLNAAASTGGGFPVTSVSPIAPTGLSIHSENVIEGTLGVGGQLPFLGTVALDGVFPTAGVGTISYGCGSGTVGIVSESPFSTGILAGPVTGPVAGLAGGYNLGGCGCGPIY